MNVDPLIQHYLEESAKALAPTKEPGLTGAQIREMSDRIAGKLHETVAEPGPTVAHVHDDTVPVAGGTIRVRVYTPEGNGPFPGHVMLHGGGWWQGSIDDWISDVQARERCHGAATVVIGVDYRLAPEHPFPTGLHDCATAWRWVLSRADDLNIDPARVSLGGTSAGGNLAAATCLLLRDAGETAPCLQLLEAPALDFSFDHPSMREYGPQFGLTEEAWTSGIRMYLPNADDALNPYASPLRETNLRGLPPAHILTAELDPLRDAAETYAERLQAAGVPVKVTRHQGQVHASPAMTAVLDGARAWRREVLNALQRIASTPAAPQPAR